MFGCYRWRPHDELPPFNGTKRGAFYYEIFVRSFDDSDGDKVNDLRGIIEKLDYLDYLGVKSIWLMPIHPIGHEGRKGSLGLYNAISDYFSVIPEFGTMRDFECFLDSIHRMGFKVILDLVANHTPPYAVWANYHKEWYLLDAPGNIITEYDWTDMAKLNYENKQLQSAMIDVMKFRI